MLGYVTLGGAGAADRLLADVAATLAGRGWPLAGAVQLNEARDDGRCHMDLHVLASRDAIRISQNLGTLASGCRLDPEGLERAVGLAEAALSQTGPERPRLVIVNKFGKQEAEGRGFRPLIGHALSEGVPVLTAVAESNLPAFLEFAGGLAEPVPGRPDAVLGWVEAAVAAT